MIRNYKNFKKYFLWVVSIVAIFIICRWVNYVVQEQNRQEEMAKIEIQNEKIRAMTEPVEVMLNSGKLRGANIPFKTTVTYDDFENALVVNMTMDVGINDYSESEFRDFIFSGIDDYCAAMEEIWYMSVYGNPEPERSSIDRIYYNINTNDNVCLAETEYTAGDGYHINLIGGVKYQGEYDHYNKINSDYSE